MELHAEFFEQDIDVAGEELIEPSPRDHRDTRCLRGVQMAPVLGSRTQALLGREVWRHQREMMACLAEMPCIVREIVRLHRTRRKRRVLVSSYVLNVGEQSVEAKDRVLAENEARAAGGEIRGFKDPSVTADAMALDAELDALCVAYEALQQRPAAERLDDRAALSAIAARLCRFEIQWQTYEWLVEQFTGMTDAINAAAERLVGTAHASAPTPESMAQGGRDVLPARTAAPISAEQATMFGGPLAVVDRDELEALSLLEAECGRRAGDVRALRERFDAAREGQQRAVNETVMRNLRIVLHAVSKHNLNRVREDAIQEGCEGMMMAALRYRYWSGLRFSTYAMFWMKNRLTRLFASPLELPYAIPAVLQDRAIDVQRVRRRLSATTGIEPPAAEVARELGLTISQVEECIRCYRQPDRGSALKWVVDGCEQERERHEAEVEVTRLVREAVRLLPSMQSKVVRLRFGIDSPPRTMRQVAYMLNISEDRCRELEQAGLHRLMRGRYAEHLQQYL
jgi:RNA polymerase primary sigma factor